MKFFGWISSLCIMAGIGSSICVAEKNIMNSDLTDKRDEKIRDNMKNEFSKAAFVDKDITPPVGTYLGGFGYRNKPSEGVADSLHLKISAFEDKDKKKVVIVAVDIVKLPKDMSWRLKMWFSEKFKTDASSLILNVTHTHCGPYLYPEFSRQGWPIDFNYVSNMEKSIRDGITEALANMQAVKIKYGLTSDDFAVSRRLPAEDGKIKWGANENGYCDNELPVIAVYDTADNLKALIYSYSCHSTAMAGYMISADYPGAIAKALKKMLGEKIHTIFLQGAGGSSKPKFYDKETKTFTPASIGQVEALGHSVGLKINSLINSGKMQDVDLDLSSNEKVIKFPLDPSKIPSDQELMNMIENDCSGYGAPPDVNRAWAIKMIDGKRTGKLYMYYDMLVNKTQLADNLTLIGCSGELTAEAGRIIKNNFTEGNLILLGYCFYTDAYIPTDEMLPEGGYEVLTSTRSLMLPAPFDKGINNILKNEISKRF